MIKPVNLDEIDKISLNTFYLWTCEVSNAVAREAGLFFFIKTTHDDVEELVGLRVRFSPQLGPFDIKFYTIQTLEKAVIDLRESRDNFGQECWVVDDDWIVKIGPILTELICAIMPYRQEWPASYLNIKGGKNADKTDKN